MSTYFILQTNYQTVEVGLYTQSERIDYLTTDKTKASVSLVSNLNTLLKKNSLNWSDIDFIGVNQGPGPFTTLRVIIATINGIAFSNDIPLIGIDGLQTFVNECYQPTTTVALLNAFNNDVYFAIKTQETCLTGWDNIERLLERIIQCCGDSSVTLIGNGVTLHKEAISQALPSVTIPTNLQLTSSLDAIAQAANEKWQKNKAGEKQLTPLYLKTGTYKVSNPNA